MVLLDAFEKTDRGEIAEHEGMHFARFREDGKLNNFLSNFTNYVGSPALEAFNPAIKTFKEPCIFQSTWDAPDIEANSKTEYNFICLKDSWDAYLLSVFGDNRRKIKKLFDEAKKWSFVRCCDPPLKELSDLVEGRAQAKGIYLSQGLTIDLFRMGLCQCYSVFKEGTLTAYLFYDVLRTTFYGLNWVFLEENNLGSTIVLAQILKAIELGLKFYDVENIVVNPMTEYKKKFFNEKGHLYVYSHGFEAPWITPL